MIRTEKLTVMINGRELIKSLDLEVLRGQFWCILGKNGVGKSTLMRTLSGLRPVQKGNIFLNGQALPSWKIKELAKIRAYLPQDIADSLGFSVFERILSARYSHASESDMHNEENLSHVENALKIMKLTDFAQREMNELSGGEKQRVAIATVFAQDTPLLLLDEPTTAIDVPHQMDLMHYLSFLCREKNKAVIIITHDINIMSEFATHALLLFENGSWKKGKFGEVMTDENLSNCFSYPIKSIANGTRRFYFPAAQP